MICVFVGNPITGEVVDRIIEDDSGFCAAFDEMREELDCDKPIWAYYDLQGISYEDAEIDFNDYFSRELLMNELFAALSA